MDGFSSHLRRKIRTIPEDLLRALADVNNERLSDAQIQVAKHQVRLLIPDYYREADDSVIGLRFFDFTERLMRASKARIVQGAEDSYGWLSVKISSVDGGFYALTFSE